ncbi:DEAD/DEAH box helicase [Methanonatronarchaeum sp. AMET6-2]|uniref:DEAD/DEAH box helicase n=1 Tax=Methanonatronarchaeum sp. AMET6-2 TaxID=2933293 RepID=UPI001FF3514B|nr:DEAD/DEAH box helicase family protein [Methanonatronarchaeum sp. AMET6-2]UOY10010.1 DEAD/DEAH box helicase family protein [Methanonatronarchaeum sp. AMET6-2]
MSNLQEEISSKLSYTVPAWLDSKLQEICFFQDSGIAFSDEFDLAIHNVSWQLGPHYSDGLRNLSDERGLIDNLREIDEDRLGRFMKELNRFKTEIEEGDIKINDFSKAVQSTINKKLLEDGIDYTLTIPEEDFSPYEVAIQILTNDDIVKDFDVVFNPLKPGFFKEELTKPIMITELWRHQKEALENWRENGCLGYVDMATATGKTVLGISTIAAIYGRLNIKDEHLEIESSEGKPRILIVAHSKLVLEQWRREFDKHLGIPPDITGIGKEKAIDRISLDWGEICFITSNKLKNLKGKNDSYDLVILDEVHRYPRKLNYFSDRIENDEISIMGLSGSIDVNERDKKRIRSSLEKNLERIKTYTLTEAKRDGIIPEFDWKVVYTDYGKDSTRIIETTKKIKNLYPDFMDSDNNPGLLTFDEIRNHSQSKDGVELKSDDKLFSDLSDLLFTRKTLIWNQAPSLSRIEEVLSQHIDEEKILVLVRTQDEVKTLRNRLESDGIIEKEKIYTILDISQPEKERDLLNEFDSQEGPGVLIGTGNKLGVGVDLQNIEIIVNMANGRFANKTLIQRMGRMLRNPQGKKEPIFYHLVPAPFNHEARVDNEDGSKILKGISQFLALGSHMDCSPTFQIMPAGCEEEFRQLEKEGTEFIGRLIEEEKYRWPTLGDPRPDKKNAKSYMEDILKKEMPDQGSLIIREYGETEKSVAPETTSEIPKTISHENGKLDSEEEKMRSQKDDREDFEGDLEELDDIIKNLDKEDKIQKDSYTPETQDTEVGKKTTTKSEEEKDMVSEETDEDPVKKRYKSDIEYLLYISKQGLVLKKLVEGPLSGETSEITRDFLEWKELPIENKLIKVNGIDCAPQEKNQALILKITDIKQYQQVKKPDTQKALIKLRDDKLINQQITESILGGTSTSEQIVPIDELPIENLDFDIIKMDKKETEDGETIPEIKIEFKKK